MGRVLEKDKQTNRRGFHPVTLWGLPAPFHSSTHKINSTCDFIVSSCTSGWNNAGPTLLVLQSAGSLSREIYHWASEQTQAALHDDENPLAQAHLPRNSILVPEI